MSLLATPLAWLHYFVLVVPLGLCLLRPGAPPGWAVSVPAAVAAGGVLALFGLGLVDAWRDGATAVG